MFASELYKKSLQHILQCADVAETVVDLRSANLTSQRMSPKKQTLSIPVLRFA